MLCRAVLCCAVLCCAVLCARQAGRQGEGGSDNDSGSSHQVHWEALAVACDRQQVNDRNALRTHAAGLDTVGQLSWVQGNAEVLPFPDNSMDAYTVAFGIRNVTDRAAALAEAWRVLRPGGRLACLEFSSVSLPLLREAYDAYSFAVIPRIGALVAGDADSYAYLVESIRRFPDQVGHRQMSVYVYVCVCVCLGGE